MWSGKKKKGSAEDFFKEEELDLELSGGRKKDKEKEDKDKRKKEKEDKKKTRDDEAKDSTGGGGGGVGLFQRKHKKSVGSSDIDHLRKEKDKEKEKEKEREKEKEKEKSGRVFHRRNKSSSSTSGDPSAAAVVASAASRLNVLGGSNPDRDPTRLGIKRETFSPPGTLNLNSGLLSSYPPPTSSPRGANNSPRNPLGGTAAGTHSGPMAALPQLADVSHKRKNSVDEVSPRFEGSPMRGLADMKQPIPISELLKRSPITSPRSPVLGRELTEQQRQILAQAKKKLQLELVRDNLALVDRPMQPSSSSDDLKREILAVLDEWDDDQEVDRERSLRDKQESEEWDRERRAKLAHLSRTSHPTSALGQYLLTRWKGQSPQQAQSSP